MIHPDRNRTWVKFGIRIGLILLLSAAIWLLIVNGSKWLQQIEDFEWQLDWFLLGASVLILWISYLLTPVGWVWLSHHAGSKVSARDLTSAWFISQLGRYVPGKIWLFAGRVGFLKSHGLSTFRATSVPFLEVLFTAAAAGLAAIIPIILTDNFSFADSGLRTVILAAGGCMLVIPLLTPMQRWLYKLKYGSIPEILTLPGITGSLKLLLLYSGLWWIRGLTLFLWLKGFGIQSIDFWICCVAAPLSWLAGYIVFLVPGGIGIREAAAVALVAPSGATGPVLAVIAGQRVLLSIAEVFLALLSTGKARVFRREIKT
ncbi:MAG: flippase-like domain-containing protein [Candidatus Aegiribacteria sp.]|nr:flippase-like domain-containing protein [Candidatus Aegiribacteria sp.]